MAWVESFATQHLGGNKGTLFGANGCFAVGVHQEELVHDIRTGTCTPHTHTWARWRHSHRYMWCKPETLNPITQTRAFLSSASLQDIRSLRIPVSRMYRTDSPGRGTQPPGAVPNYVGGICAEEIFFDIFVPDNLNFFTKLVLNNDICTRYFPIPFFLCWHILMTAFSRDFPGRCPKIYGQNIGF